MKRFIALSWLAIVAACAVPLSCTAEEQLVQAATGALARSLHDKLSESASIVDFGASTAATDNSAAIQNALNASSSVYVPEGTWAITSSVALNSDQVIYGPGVIKRTNPGFILTANGKSNLTVSTNFSGDVNSWAISLKGVDRAKVIGCHATDIMLLETNSTTAAYSTTNVSNMSSNVLISENTGVATAMPNADSQQFIRVLYTHDFSVINNTADGYRDFILAWGGDYTISGAVANQRKAYKGLIEGNRGRVLAAGIWTGMARDISIIGNRILGSNGGEGLDAEGSVNITFTNNDAFNFSDGVALFGINQNIKFIRNNVSASANAFRNANSIFSPDYGLVELDGNSFKSTVSATIGGIISAAERVHFTNNRFENVELTLSDVAIAELIFNDNILYYDYPPHGVWHVRLGGITDGYSQQPKLPQIVVKRNRIEWRGTGRSSKRAFGLTSSRIAHTIDIQQNEFIGINEQISYEGSVGAMTVLAKRNVFDAAAGYPSVLHGTTEGLTVIWQDNDRNDGRDAYGTNAPPASYFSAGSRIWSNAPAEGSAHGWVYRSGAWEPMADIQK